MLIGRQAAAVALREVLRELYPAALRAYPDPAAPAGAGRAGRATRAGPAHRAASRPAADGRGRGGGADSAPAPAPRTRSSRRSRRCASRSASRRAAAASTSRCRPGRRGHRTARHRRGPVLRLRPATRSSARWPRGSSIPSSAGTGAPRGRFPARARAGRPGCRNGSAGAARRHRHPDRRHRHPARAARSRPEPAAAGSAPVTPRPLTRPPVAPEPVMPPPLGARARSPRRAPLRRGRGLAEPPPIPPRRPLVFRSARRFPPAPPIARRRPDPPSGLAAAAAAVARTPVVPGLAHARSSEQPPRQPPARGDPAPADRTCPAGRERRHRLLAADAGAASDAGRRRARLAGQLAAAELERE